MLLYTRWTAWQVQRRPHGAVHRLRGRDVCGLQERLLRRGWQLPRRRRGRVANGHVCLWPALSALDTAAEVLSLLALLVQKYK